MLLGNANSRHLAMIACGVVAPGAACVVVLAGGGGVVEAEGVGDDGGGTCRTSWRRAEMRAVRMGRSRSRSWISMER